MSVPLLLTPDPTQGLRYYGWRWLTFSGAAAIWPGIQRETYGWLWPLALLWIPLAGGLLRGWRARLLLFSSWAWLGFIFLCKHAGALNHYGLIFLFFLYAWCLDLGERGETGEGKAPWPRRGLVWLFAGVVLAHIAYAAIFFRDHRGKHFSGAAEMAAYLREAGLAGRELVSYPAYVGTALLPYLPGQQLYQMEDGRKVTFMTWTLEYFQGLNTPFPSLYSRMIAHYLASPEVPDSILFLCDPSVPEQSGWELLFQNSRPSIKEDEFFRLYRIRPDRAPEPPPDSAEITRVKRL